MSEAATKAREYDWLGAVLSYEETLGKVVETDTQTKGRVHEEIAWAFYRAAMQADRLEEFRDRIERALSACERARENYELVDPDELARTARSRSMTAFLKFWLSTTVIERRKWVNESWKLAQESLDEFRRNGSSHEYIRTYTRLSPTAFIAVVFEDTPKVAEDLVRQGLQHGEQAITYPWSEDPDQAARANTIAGIWMDSLAYAYLHLEETETYYNRARNCWLKAIASSDRAAILERSTWDGLIQSHFLEYDENPTDSMEKALGVAYEARDKVAIAGALNDLASTKFGRSREAEDPDQRSGLMQSALALTEQVDKSKQSIPFIGEVPNAESWALHYWNAQWETEIGRKRELLLRLKTTVEEGASRCHELGLDPAYVGDVFSRILTSLAHSVTNRDDKRKLLQQALEHRRKSLEWYDLFMRFDNFDRGRGRIFLGDIFIGLADLAENEQKRELLREAVHAKEEGCKIFSDHVAMQRSNYGFASELGNSFYSLGGFLDNLFAIESSSDHLKKAIEAYTSAERVFQRIDKPSRIAECRWKAAQSYDALGDHERSAESFLEASQSYRQAADKIEKLRNFYNSHSAYMEAWSEIERARWWHSRQEYARAGDSYKRAARLHKSTESWSYLESNYSACARLEAAEELSSKESSQEAIEILEEAAALFESSKIPIHGAAEKMVSGEEKQMIKKLLKFTDLRIEYCRARVLQEQARLSVKKGEQTSAAEKFSKAAVMFDEIGGKLESERAREEFKLLKAMCIAWEKMALADARESPDLYSESSVLFENAVVLSKNESSTMLLQGHSRLCKAMESGARFADTSDPTFHSQAVKHLESASKYYLKSGYQNGAEYADATKLLLDAYYYMNEASGEKDHEKKAKLYLMAENLLRASEESFDRAKQPAKRDQVRRLLERTTKEKALSISLMQILKAPFVLSAPGNIIPPTARQETAVGLERLANADIQGSIIAPHEILTGQDLKLEIEMVNAGRGPAQLIKIEHAIPEGFELAARPDHYRIEDSYVNMKGKQLEPLKTEEVKLVLRAKQSGSFTLKPRILYLDDGGKYKIHEPEPVQLTVKELGISGWLKGR